jgi:hypothetical protein
MRRNEGLIPPLPTLLRFRSRTSNQKMGLSNEGIISLFGVLVNLPAALLILWKHFVRKRQGGVNEAGLSLIYHVTYRLVYLI